MSTIGVELEWADVDRWSIIPEALGRWNDQDYSIVNSDGHGNCPTGETWRWGGEINTVPTHTPREQAEITRELAALLNPTINYKCNLHVHVKPDFDLLSDVRVLKLAATLMREAEPFVWKYVDPIPSPSGDPDTDEWKGEKKRWTRNMKSHHGSINASRWEEMMAAETTQAFKDAHAPPTKTGGRAWHVVQRTGMNLRSLWKHGTIEFRHFFGTADPEEIEDATAWCQAFIDMVVDSARFRPDITGENIAQYVYHGRKGGWKFPTPRPYDHKLAVRFEETKWTK